MKPTVANSNNSLITRRKFRLLIKAILDNLSFSINPDNSKKLRRVKFWTTEIRGHYSRLPIGNDYIEFLIDVLGAKSIEQNELADTLTIHYRLGDLVYLSDKSYIPSINLLIAIKDVYKRYSFDKILIFSDSIEIAKEKLINLGELTNNIEFSCAPTITLIKESLKSGYFIGTNSKVSFWIQTIRKYSGKGSLIVGEGKA